MRSKVYKIQFLDYYGVIKEVVSSDEIEGLKNCTLREVVQFLDNATLYGYESCKIYDSDFRKCLRKIVVNYG